MGELDIARIRAYAVTLPLMAATRFSGSGQSVKMNIEIVRFTLGNGVESIAKIFGVSVS